MTTVVTVLYADADGATFDLDYYLGTHMPMVAERLRPFGMSAWRVLKAADGAVGSGPAFGIVTTLEFASPGQFEAGMAAEGGPVVADVPNFSNRSPVVVVGELVGAG